MDFSFTEEQDLLRNTVQRFVQDKYDFETRRAVVAGEAGWRPECWREFAELGLLAAPFPEEAGGLGGSPVDTMVLMEEFGRGLVVEPYLQTVVLGGGFLNRAGSAAQKEEHLAKIIAGELVTAFAFAETGSRFNLADVSTTARKTGSGYTLSGQKSVVLGAPWAGALLVTARTGGTRREESGITLFLVDKSARGVSVRDYPTVDGLRASEITFENVEVGAEAVIGEVDGALPVLERVTDEAIAALCAEGMGLMRKATELTVEYTKTRTQFGQPIGRFQVLQHRMVDMFVKAEEMVSLTFMATLKLEESDAERKKAVSAAKAHLGTGGLWVGKEAVQLHGGMGVTEEMAVGHYFKRLTMANVLFGNADHHLKRFAALS